MKMSDKDGITALKEWEIFLTSGLQFPEHILSTVDGNAITAVSSSLVMNSDASLAKLKQESVEN